MKTTVRVSATLLAVALSLQTGFQPVLHALTVTEAVHSLQTADPTLPSLPSGASPKGNVGYVLSNIFW